MEILAIRRIFLLLPLFLVGCGSDGDSGVPVQMVIESGDGQVVVQHAVVIEPLIVRTVGANNRGIGGVEVQFSTATGSDYITPASDLTDAQGLAMWQGYVHAGGGQQLVQASAIGLPSAIFTLGVTPSNYAYDGLYDCDFFMDSGAVGPPGYLRYRIENGEPFNATLDEQGGWTYYGKSFDESDGSISLIQRWSLDYQLQFTGELLISSDQRATGSGAWVKLNMLQPIPPDQLGAEDFGTWNCSRQ